MKDTTSRGIVRLVALACGLLPSVAFAQSERRLVDLNPNGSSIWAHRYAAETFTSLYGEVLLTTTYPGPVIWATDGSPGNARRVADIGDAFGNAIHNFVPGIGFGFFAAWDPRGIEVWRTDATPAGTTIVRDLPGYGHGGTKLDAAELDGWMFFRGRTSSGMQVFRSDGTAAGTTLLAPLANPAGFIRSGRYVYFLAGSPNYSLWRTDGTSVGTVEIKKISAIRMQSYPLELTDGRIVWLTLGNSRFELWISDGSANGTRLLRTFIGGNPAVLPAPGPGFFYYVNPSGSGTEIWYTDGNGIGQQLASNSTSRLFVPRVEGTMFRGQLYFPFSSPSSGRELWVSDGTPTGTRQFLDLRSGPSDSDPYSFTPVGDRYLYFLADDNGQGYRVWRTDGTPAGTRRMTNVSVAGRLTHALGKLFFAGEDPTLVWGREPFVLDLDHANSEPLGTGCTANGSEIEIRTDDPILGRTTRTTLRRAAAGRPASLFSGIRTYPDRVSAGCSLYLDTQLPYFSLVFATNAQGVGHVDYTVPNVTSLLGVQLAQQAMVGPTGRAPLGHDLSPGLLITLGR